MKSSLDNIEMLKHSINVRHDLTPECKEKMLQQIDYYVNKIRDGIEKALHQYFNKGFIEEGKIILDENEL